MQDVLLTKETDNDYQVVGNTSCFFDGFIFGYDKSNDKTIEKNSATKISNSNNYQFDNNSLYLPSVPSTPLVDRDLQKRFKRLQDDTSSLCDFDQNIKIRLKMLKDDTKTKEKQLDLCLK